MKTDFENNDFQTNKSSLATERKHERDDSGREEATYTDRER